MTPEETPRQKELRVIRGAAQSLSKNKDWERVWIYLQKRYPIAAPVFETGHEGNTHRAAKRGGNREVMSHILALMTLPLEVDFEIDAMELKPAEATSNTHAPV